MPYYTDPPRLDGWQLVWEFVLALTVATPMYVVFAAALLWLWP